MEDLQSTLQSILSDPEQMARVASLAESLGLKPPNGEQANAQAGHSERSEESVFPSDAQTDGIANPLSGLDLPRLMAQFHAVNGTEDKVLRALRPSLSQEGQRKADRALRAAKLSRLVGQFLNRQRDGHV